MSRASVALAIVALALGALAGCASTKESPTASASAVREPPHDDFGLPPVRAALEFPPEAHEVRLAWLVDELARLTGQELAMAPEVRQSLEANVESLELATPVPAREVYGFVEALLAAHGIFVAPVTGGERPVLGFYSNEPRGNVSQPCAVAIQPEQCARLADHPALLCQVMLTFENVDSRQLQTQLRQLLVDSGPLQQCVPAGERGLLIQGSGARLRGLVQLLREVDRASAQRPREGESVSSAR